MIPRTLTISGFLSYRAPVTIDFTPFDLACIAGANGAGKSSLLDAITWVLFGRARKTDDSVINSHPEIKAAQVTLEFEYETNLYRIQRTSPRGKTTVLEFQIAQPGDQLSVIGDRSNPNTQYPISNPQFPITWKPLTERALRDTQRRIEETLRLDYDTFVNASFFLQGKADQFTQQTSSRRKAILSSILGLETWETYRKTAADRRKLVESDIENLNGRLQEITAELDEETARKTRLAELQTQLKNLAKTRAAQEQIVENARQIAATLTEQRKLVETLNRQRAATQTRRDELLARAGERAAERDALTQTLSRAAEIQAAYQAWQDARAQLTSWDATAARFRAHETRRNEPLTQIREERALLQKERDNLLQQQTQISNLHPEITNLQSQISNTQKELTELETSLSLRATLETALQTALHRQAEAKAENPRLRAEMNDLKERIDRLKTTEGATCPLCGQPLTPDDRTRLITELETHGKDKGDQYRANQTLLKEADDRVRNLQAQISNLHTLDTTHRAHTTKLAALEARLAQITDAEKDWHETGLPQLTAVQTQLAEEDFALDARAALAQIDAELKEIGYDAAEHDRIRSLVNDPQPETALRTLERAQAALTPLANELSNLQSQISNLETELSQLQTDHTAALTTLTAAETAAPDLALAQRALLDLQEQENILRTEVGMAKQKVEVLDALRARRKTLETERETLAQTVTRYKQLEKAFGKDGVPALLIEQALPQIEAKANELLDRLTNGEMSVRFQTQRELKTSDALRETLDIQISDRAGTRDYEMYSVDGTEPVYIRQRNGQVLCVPIQDLWKPNTSTEKEGEYEIQPTDFESLCYANGKVIWQPVQEILRHPAPPQMLKIKCHPGNYSVTITPNHSIFIMTPKGLKIKRGDELKAGDWVLTPRHVPQSENQRDVDLVEWITPDFIAQRERNGKTLLWDEKLIWSRCDQPLNRLIQNDPAFGEFLGVAVAEASGKKALTISVGTDETMALRVINLANTLLGVSRTSPNMISSETISRYIEKYPGLTGFTPQKQYRPFVGGRLAAHIIGNMIGQGAINKHIPSNIFNASDETKKMFLKGLIAGDGYHRIRPEKSQNEIGITTISPQLVADTIFLCRQLGLWAGIQQHGEARFARNANHRQSYRMAISGYRNIALINGEIKQKQPTYQTEYEGIPLELVNITRNTKQRRLRRVPSDERYDCGPRVIPMRNQEQYERISTWLQDWAVLEIKTIETVQPKSSYVYDLVVPDNHSFVAGPGMILVHNSGGEAFRANFAIRLALSEILAQRAGARLQTLVIDEGFGSQDTLGRQRLIEAINMVKPDFAKILVITHIDELKEAFPTRIEVEKTDLGSAVRVM